MILAYSKAEFEAVRAFLSMTYWTSNGFRQGGLLWPRNTSTSRKAGLPQNTLYPSSPARTTTAPTSTASQQAICQLQNEWAKTRPFAGTIYTPHTVEPHLQETHLSGGRFGVNSESARACLPKIDHTLSRRSTKGYENDHEIRKTVDLLYYPVGYMCSGGSTQ
jgi:hypothetical protein